MNWELPRGSRTGGYMRTAEEYRTPIEPVFNHGYRCRWCDIQIPNPSIRPGVITYCHRCGQAYECGTLWQKLRKDK